MEVAGRVHVPMRTLIRALCASFLVVVSLFGVPLLPAQSPSDAIGDTVLLTGYTEGGDLTGAALISVPFTADFADTPIVTVFLDMDEKEKFKWEKAVDRVPSVAVAEFPTTYPVDFSEKKVRKLLEREDPLYARVLVTDVPGGPIEKQVAVTRETLDIPEFLTDTPPGFTGAAGSREWFMQGGLPGSIPSVKADGVPAGANGAYNPGVPDNPGRKGHPNECFPIAAANSIQWLAAQHNMTDKLPATTDQLLDQLDQAVGYNPNTGTQDTNMVSGKDAFAQSTGLPLVNEKVDNTMDNGASTLFPKIVQALKDKKDVELIMKRKSSATGKATAGHAVTVVGAYTKGKKQYIVIHDVLSPNGNDTYEVGRNGEVKGYNAMGGKVYVEFMITEAIRT